MKAIAVSTQQIWEDNKKAHILRIPNWVIFIRNECTDDILFRLFFFTEAGAEQLDLRTYPDEQDIKESEYMLNITLLINHVLKCCVV